MEGSHLGRGLFKFNYINSSLKKLESPLRIILPRIAVVGFVNIGKTSMLEQLIGLEFFASPWLIRNTNTRCPIEIHFNHSPELEEPYALLEQTNEEGTPLKLTNLSSISEQLQKLHSKLEIRRSISAKPILLRIYSKACPTITFIDTPGYNMIENLSLTKQIILNYITQPETVILPVLPPSLDHGGRTILMLTRKVDPYQRRTVACLTKLDIMDRGTDAVMMVTNQELPMRYGFVGIVNRSQGQRNLKDGLKREDEYFFNSPAYSKLPPSLLGMAALSKKLEFIISNQISPQLKQVWEQISRRKREILQQQKQGCGLTESTNRLIRGLSLLKGYICDEFPKRTPSALRVKFKQFLLEEYRTPATQDISQYQVHKIVHNYFTNSPSQIIFYEVLRKLTKKSKQYAAEVYTLFQEEVNHIIDESSEFKIHSNFKKMALTIIQNNYNDLTTFLQKLLDSEWQLFTNNQQYFSQNFKVSKRTGKQNTYAGQVKQRLDCYLRITIQNLRDLIPKQIINFLIVKTQNKLEAQQHPQLQNTELKELNNLESFIQSDTVLIDAINKEEFPYEANQQEHLLPSQERKEANIQQPTLKEENQTEKYKNFNHLFGVSKSETQTEQLKVDMREKQDTCFINFFGAQKSETQIQHTKVDAREQQKKIFHKLFGL